jgi:hypothetical protein
MSKTQTSVRNINHNPDPITERGKRRRRLNHPEGISHKHPAWVEGGFLCNQKPKDKG